MPLKLKGELGLGLGIDALDDVVGKGLFRTRLVVMCRKGTS